MSHTHDCNDPNHTHSHDEGEEESQEIYIEVSEDGFVLLTDGEWTIELDPEEARALAQALTEAANDAESAYAEAG